MEIPRPGTKYRTLTDAYSRFGIALSNPRTAWSAQSEDGNVVVTLWTDLFKDTDRRVYDVLQNATGAWVVKKGNKDRIKHLKYVQAHCDGIFDSIIVTPADESHEQIVRRQIEIGPKMRLVGEIDEVGRFRAERVGS